MRHRLFQQGISIAGIRIVGTGLSVCATILIGRAFGQEILGVYSYCIALLAIACVPISNGWAILVLRTVAKDAHFSGLSQGLIRHGLVVGLLCAMMAGGAGWLLASQSTAQIAKFIMPVAGIAVSLLVLTMIFDQMSALRMAILRGLDRPIWAQAPEMLVRPALLLAGVGSLAFFGFQGSRNDLLVALFSALAFAAFLSYLFGQAILSQVRPHGQMEPISAGQQRAWYSSAAALAGTAGLVQLNGYSDLLILGGLSDAAQVGLYRAALQIAMLANFGYVALNMLASQRFAKFLAAEDNAALAHTAKFLARIALLAAIPLPIILLLAGSWIFDTLFGAAFSEAWVPALIVSTGFCFSAATGMAHALLIMSDGEFLAVRATATAVFVNAFLCFVLIPQFGLIGAALANAIANVLWNIALWYLAKRRTGIDTSVLSLPTARVRTH